MMNFSSSFSITEIVENYYKGRVRVTEKNYKAIKNLSQISRKTICLILSLSPIYNLFILFDIHVIWSVFSLAPFFSCI